MTIENQERLVWQGQRAEKTREARALKTLCESLRDQARMALNPFDDISELDHELAVRLVFELSDRIIRYTELTSGIAAIDKTLGSR